MHLYDEYRQAYDESNILLTNEHDYIIKSYGLDCDDKGQILLFMEIANQGSFVSFIEEQSFLFIDQVKSIVLKTKLLRDSFLALKFLHN